MQISSTGFVKATLDNYLEYMTADIQADGTFGANYTIKKEGVVDNLLATVSNAFVSLEDKIAYALKQLNPYTAEGEWQDALYSIVGLTRNYATYTTVTRTISGTAGTTIGVNELVFKTAQDDQFYLNTEVTIGDNGTIVGSFTAYELGSIECDTTSNLEIISAPLGVNGVFYSEGNVTTVGDDYESDSEFRLRWLATNSVQSSNNEGGLRVALLPLVNNNGADLIVKQNRTNSTSDGIPAHSVHIILKSSESDNTIAQAILDNITDGVGMTGSTTITLKDSEGTEVDVKFSRAKEVPIYFKVEVVLIEGYPLDDVIKNVRNAILNNFTYSTGEKVVANDFYQYINALDGVDYIASLKVGRSASNMKDVLVLDEDEYSSVIKDNISVDEE